MGQNVKHISIAGNECEINVRPRQRCRIVNIRLLVTKDEETGGLAGIADGISEMLSHQPFEQEPFVLDWTYSAPLEESPEYVLGDTYEEGDAVVP